MEVHIQNQNVLRSQDFDFYNYKNLIILSGTFLNTYLTVSLNTLCNLNALLLLNTLCNLILHCLLNCLYNQPVWINKSYIFKRIVGLFIPNVSVSSIFSSMIIVGLVSYSTLFVLHYSLSDLKCLLTRIL